jgi:pimeloyl-ACP methyl ester carboxylesterase
MFGFATVASFSYFEHVVRAIGDRFALRGRAARVHVCDVHPTASVRRRAVKLAETIRDTAGEGADPVHIVGHSTGGLDGRLVASPAVHLPGLTDADLAWLPRLCSVTTINTPHYGTPLAAFFATKSGQQALYALMALTVTGLKLGAPPLAAASALMAAFSRVSGAIELEVIERTSESIIRVLDDASSRDLRSFLRQIRDDQGAVIQLTPEAMDLFQAGVEDRVGVRYQCVASYAPRGGTLGFLRSVSSPWSVVSAAIFTTFYNITARTDPRYPCNAGDKRTMERVRAMLGELPADIESDGVVPLYSQIWGDPIWIGRADHLDIVGHFPGRKGSGHVDWLRSGAGFDDTRFETVMDRIVAGMLLAEEKRR